MLPGFQRRKRQWLYRTNLTKRDVRCQLITLLGLLALVLVVHTAAMMAFEQLSLGDAVWLSLTSATTVGYGDISASTFWGRTSTIILLYLGGIALLAQSAALYFEYRQEIHLQKLLGDWHWTMKNHLVFLNSPQHGEVEYFSQLFNQLRQSRALLAGQPASTIPILIAAPCFSAGLPERLQELHVTHINRAVTDPALFKAANIADASIIVVLASEYLDPISDSINFELIDRLRAANPTARIIVEAVRDVNRQRLLRVGADTALRPIRSYPEMLSRSIIAPGSEQVIETLFNSYDEECVRFSVTVNAKWRDIVMCLLDADLGLPIAYEEKCTNPAPGFHYGPIINNPPGNKDVRAVALFLVVHELQMVTKENVQAALARFAAHNDAQATTIP